MADEEAGISLWDAVADFFCMLTPQQYMFLPTVIAVNIYCSTGENQRFLIADFFSLLGQALATIASQPSACEAILEKRQDAGKKDNSKSQQEDEEQDQEKSTVVELETGARANPAEQNIANAMSFE